MKRMGGSVDVGIFAQQQLNEETPTVYLYFDHVTFTMKCHDAMHAARIIATVNDALDMWPKPGDPGSNWIGLPDPTGENQPKREA